MKKIAWFKHPNDLSNDKRLSALIDHEGGRGFGTYLYAINRTTTHPQKMARKLHQICQTIGKKLIDNYQTTDKELPNNLETLCKNKEKHFYDNNLNISNKIRKPALARVRVDKSRVDESRKNDFVVKKNGDEGEVQATQNAMPSFRSWRELIGNLTEGNEWKDRVCNPSSPNATPEQGKCHTQALQMPHLNRVNATLYGRPSVASTSAKCGIEGVEPQH